MLKAKIKDLEFVSSEVTPAEVLSGEAEVRIKIDENNVQSALDDAFCILADIAYQKARKFGRMCGIPAKDVEGFAQACTSDIVYTFLSLRDFEVEDNEMWQEAIKKVAEEENVITNKPSL